MVSGKMIDLNVCNVNNSYTVDVSNHGIYDTFINHVSVMLPISLKKERS